MSQALHNAASNFLAGLLPAMVLLVATPVLVHGLGTEGYGLLVLILSVTSYMSMFDINMTAGSVKFIAEYHANRDARRVMQVICFGLVIYTVIAAAGASFLILGAPWLASVFAKSFDDQTVRLVRIAALGFVFSQFQAYLMSVPQGLQRYDISGRVETAFGILAPLFSALFVLMGAQLIEVIWLRNVLGALSLAALVMSCIKLLDNRVHWSWPEKSIRERMLGFTAFAYLSRVASITYAHADKLVIGAVLGARDVAYFTVPALLANRIFSLAFRSIHMVFPMTSALLANSRLAEVERLVIQATRYTFYLNAAAVAAVSVLSGWFLDVWLGPEFAEKGCWIMALVAGGALIDSLTNVPSLVTDGGGRTQLTGSFALVRCVAGLLAVYSGAMLGGIEGVALAHFGTSAVFTVAFLTVFFRIVSPVSIWTWFRQAIAPGAGVGLLIAGGGYICSGLPVDRSLQVAIAIAVMAPVMLVGGWFLVFQEDVRVKIRQRLPCFRRVQ
ncbi:oligosaccharide flippase family protein [Accumulibacter sp.]|uniref:oligosaccharide flippase family protein n=1 Tax=Accumulibacter sp. TaxID=2053492 RepID=UPI0025FA36F9|nr:oligosaccharide flippase family protein [Accumulibacter sp.]MCM8611623.1 oligosaccharide flippase family protein [Accumulibacter sp.]MCM8635388.1 oligosaccharide flippase family protein [Accumulibacter sp.]MCM8638993.1 oligosaccharide flippase family protein [Accumulibacter sp.]